MHVVLFYEGPAGRVYASDGDTQLWLLGEASTVVNGGAAVDAGLWIAGDWLPDETEGHTRITHRDCFTPGEDADDEPQLIAVYHRGQLHINRDERGRVVARKARGYLGTLNGQGEQG